MQKLSRNVAAGGPDEPLRLATIAAQQTKQRAAAARTKFDLAKARYKRAKKELKRAKKTAKKAAKRARAAQKELEAWIEKAAQARPRMRSTRLAPVRQKPVRKRKAPVLEPKSRQSAAGPKGAIPGPPAPPALAPKPLETRPASRDIPPVASMNDTPR